MLSKNSTESPYPYYIAVESRALTKIERETVRRIVANLDPATTEQVDGLMVVGRCGCGNCPTVFFQAHATGDKESAIHMLTGKDIFGGFVGVTLFEKNGQLSQLDYYSMDGHEPWQPPEPEVLESP